jgi:hypothetical protein
VASKDFVPGDIILCLPPIAAGTVHCQSTAEASIHHKIKNNEERKAQNNITLQIWQIFRSNFQTKFSSSYSPGPSKNSLCLIYSNLRKKRKLLGLDIRMLTLSCSYFSNCNLLYDPHLKAAATAVKFMGNSIAQV